MSVYYLPIQAFLDYLKFEKRYSQNTIISYRTDLVDFFDYLLHIYGEGLKIEEISHLHIRSWFASLMDGKENEKLSPKSVARKISTLKSFYKFQLRMGKIKLSPMTNIVIPKSKKRLPVFVKEPEVENILKKVNNIPADEKLGAKWKGQNKKMLIFLFYNTGLRLSELINLKNRNIDLSRGQIKVLGKGNKERIIPITPALINEIRLYEEAKRKQFSELPEEYFVTEKGKKLYPKYVYLLVKEVLKEAPTLERKSPHVLRHTFATHLMNNGADLNAVKELLGHSSLASTQVYTHNTIEKLKEAHKKAHPKA